MPKIINYINLQNSQTFSFDKLVNDKASFKNRKTPVGARFLYGDIISHSFKIADNLSKQELLVKIELKMYEDIGLDPTKTYQISYIQKEVALNSEILLEAFAVDKDAVSNKYQNYVKKSKYIDFIAIPFLVFQTLYTNKTLEPKNDIFIYISYDEAFTTSYKDGNYISSKRIKTIDDMVHDLGSRNITISSEELYEIITTKGLKKSSYELLQYELYEYLVETFETLFSKIKNLSLHNRNVYSFTQIDRVFFTCNQKNVPHLQEQVQSYVENAEFKTLNFLQTKTVNVLDAISSSYIKDKLSQNDHDHNVTLFKPKAPFYKSEVGKFTFATVASALILSIYPIYLQLEISSKKQENEILIDKELQISKTSKKFQLKLKKIKTQISQYNQKKEIDQKKLQNLQSIANSLLLLKSKDTKYTDMILKINKILGRYHLSIDKITQTDTHALNLELSSKKDKRDTIALFMKDLLNNGFSSAISSEITLKDDDIYKSIVTVKR